MLALPLIIKYYMYSFLLIDSISGFIRIYLEITNPVFNIGYWTRGPILILLIYFYFLKLFKKNIFFDELLTIVLFIFFLLNGMIYYLDNSSLSMLVENLTYILRFQFLLFLYVFLKNRMDLDIKLTKRPIAQKIGASIAFIIII